MSACALINLLWMVEICVFICPWIMTVSLLARIYRTHYLLAINFFVRVNLRKLK